MDSLFYVSGLGSLIELSVGSKVETNLFFPVSPQKPRLKKYLRTTDQIPKKKISSIFYLKLKTAEIALKMSYCAFKRPATNGKYNLIFFPPYLI